MNKLRIKIKENYFAIIFLFIGVVLRLYRYNRRPLDFDELGDFSKRFLSNDLNGLLSTFSRGDDHLPFVSFISFVFYEIFGYNDYAARIPSTIFDIAAIFSIYYISKNLFDKISAQITIVLYSFSFTAIYYAQSSRSYSLYILLSIWFIYFFIKLFEQKPFPRKKVLIGFGVMTFFLANAHLGSLSLIFLCLFLILLKNKFNKISSIVITYLIIVIFLPIFMQIYNYRSVSAIPFEYYKMRTDYILIKEIFNQSFLNSVHGQSTSLDNYYFAYFVISLLVLLVIYSLKRWKGFKGTINNYRIILTLLVVPIFICSLMAMVGLPLVKAKIIIYYLPLIYLLFGASGFPLGVKKLLLFVLILWSPYNLIINYRLYEYKVNYEYREPVKRTIKYYEKSNKKYIISGCEKIDAEVLRFYYHYNNKKLKNIPITRVCNQEDMSSNFFMKHYNYLVHHVLFYEMRKPKAYIDKRAKLLLEFEKEGWVLEASKHTIGNWNLSMADKGIYDVEQLFLRKVEDPKL